MCVVSNKVCGEGQLLVMGFFLFSTFSNQFDKLESDWSAQIAETTNYVKLSDWLICLKEAQ